MPQLPFPLWLAVWTVILTLGGRSILAWLPAGSPGGHAWRDVLVTAAASLLAGLASWSVFTFSGVTSPWAFVGWIVATALLGAVRLALAPAPMVPRHEPPLARTSWIARGLIAAAGAVIVTRPAFLAGDAITGAAALAVLALVIHALDVARCGSWVRGSGALLFALVLTTLQVETMSCWSAFYFCAGAACTIPWFRRADQRALALAAIFFASAMPFEAGAWILSVSGIAWLVIGTPRPSRRRALVVGLAALAVAFVVAYLQPDHELLPPGGSFGMPTLALVVLMFALVAAGRFLDLRRARDVSWNPSGARVGHEESILLRLIVTVLLLSTTVRLMSRDVPASDAIAPSMLVLALIAGLSLKRFARVSTARATS